MSRLIPCSQCAQSDVDRKSRAMDDSYIEEKTPITEQPGAWLVLNVFLLSILRECPRIFSVRSKTFDEIRPTSTLYAFSVEECIAASRKTGYVILYLICLLVV